MRSNRWKHVVIASLLLFGFANLARCSDADPNEKNPPATRTSWPLWQLVTSRQKAAAEAERQRALTAAEQAKVQAHRNALVKQRDDLLAEIKKSVSQLAPQNEAQLSKIKAMEGRLSRLYQEEMKLMEQAAKLQMSSVQLQDKAMQAAEMISQARQWMQKASHGVANTDEDVEELHDILSDMNQLVDRLSKWGIKMKHRAEVSYKNSDKNAMRLAAVRKHRELELKATKAAIQQALEQRVALEAEYEKQQEQAASRRKTTIDRRVANVEKQLLEIKQLLLDMKTVREDE